MKTIKTLFPIGILQVLLLAVSTSLPSALLADDNPFEAAAQDAYTGRFRSAEVELRLVPEAGQWHGSLVFKGKTYTAAGAAKAGQLDGTFTEGDQNWPFTAKSDGEQLTFTAGTFTAPLTRQKLPKLEGVYASKRVKLAFKNEAAGINGVLTFNGKQFPFSAAEANGDLDGVFKSGDEAFQFTLANDPAGLTFQTGKFSEVVRWTPQRQAATPFANAGRWTNSLGLVFVKVPGTEASFSIWDTRVQDYQTYAASSEGIDSSWKNPSYDNVPVTPQATCPVVYVSWNDAKAFCQWLTEQERADGVLTSEQSYRLPTDAEWSVAVGLREASAGSPRDKDQKAGVYPWGTSWPPPNQAGNYDDYSSPKIAGFSDGYPRTSPVGSFAANQFGLYDMGGNVWQWCEDWYSGEQKSRVLRGASWRLNYPGDLLSSRRYNYSPDTLYNNIGFRCVLVDSSSR